MTCNKNPQKITKMFDEISSYYDKMNNLISLGTHLIIKKTAIKNLKIRPNSYILDLCCGTGDFTKIIANIEPSSKIIGLDASENMIKTAKQKNPKKIFIQGDCTRLIFKENEFDYITIGFGLRNIEDRQKAISEIYRTLKPNGKFLHLDFGNHTISGKLFNFLVLAIINCFGIIFNLNKDSYKYLIQSRNEYPEPEKLIKEFENYGFKLIKRKDFFFGAISFQILQK